MQMQEHVILAPFTTFGIGGSADFFCVVSSKEELGEAVAFARKKQIPYFVLGSGANILIGDKGYRGLVIKNEAKHYVIPDLIRDPVGINNNGIAGQARNDMGGVLLTAESGITIAELIEITAEKGLSGLEHFAGIPSTVGGALWQNLHFLNPDRSRTFFISEIVESALVLPEDAEVVMPVRKDYFQFTYDYSILHERKDVVLSATFILTKENPDVIKERIVANKKWREEKHPFEAWKNSAGSVFKKIEGHGAGRLIEKVGLKGYTIGGAQISEKHANFIVNNGGATAKNVRDLIDLVESKVQKELGLIMQTEISFVGEF
jgi:UDP-N-acetylmuramate dehydrogenase